MNDRFVLDRPKEVFRKEHLLFIALRREYCWRNGLDKCLREAYESIEDSIRAEKRAIKSPLYGAGFSSGEVFSPDGFGFGGASVAELLLLSGLDWLCEDDGVCVSLLVCAVELELLCCDDCSCEEELDDDCSDEAGAEEAFGSVGMTGGLGLTAGGGVGVGVCVLPPREGAGTMRISGTRLFCVFEDSVCGFSGDCATVKLSFSTLPSAKMRNTRELSVIVAPMVVGFTK